MLVRCSASAPGLTGDLAHGQQITVPVTRPYSASTTHLGMITTLKQTAGVADTGDTVTPRIRQRVTVGKITEYTPGQQVNVAAVITDHPDMMVTTAPTICIMPFGVDNHVDAEWLKLTSLGLRPRAIR
ncbi:hypothetical protein [Mycobacterium leprae]|uniref:hypothetical protein n=1 Tax=Mycobacterium leprae TaxID=1769 RepID=UPI000303ACDE|nr:hypothetical protein [Mycobacterium leprae]